MSNDNDVKIEEEEAIGNLYLCDCPDDSQHTTTEVHQPYCSYKMWYLDRLKTLREEAAKK